MSFASVHIKSQYDDFLTRINIDWYGYNFYFMEYRFLLIYRKNYFVKNMFKIFLNSIKWYTFILMKLLFIFLFQRFYKS